MLFLPSKVTGTMKAIQIIRPKIGGKIIVPYMKTLDDYLHTCVWVKPLMQLGYVWGGQPRQEIDKPDILYISVAGKDYEVLTTSVEPAVLSNKVLQDIPFENTSGDDEVEEAS